MSSTSILNASSYKPALGGHAPGDVRDAFLNAVEDLRSWQPGMPEPVAELRERQVPIAALCGVLWNCTDTLPSLAGSEVWSFVERYGDGYEAGQRAAASYGRAARALKAIFTKKQQQAA